MLGDNFVKLVGKVTKKRFNEYPSGAVLFKCVLAIPTPPVFEKLQYINISAWGDMAKALNELNNGTYIKVQGHLEKSSFDTKCRYCNGASRSYWTEVAIDNFLILENLDG
jgi:primosomal replication protein N